MTDVGPRDDRLSVAVPRGVVGLEIDRVEVGRRCRLAAVDRGDTASIAGWFELGHEPRPFRLRGTTLLERGGWFHRGRPGLANSGAAGWPRSNGEFDIARGCAS